MTYQTTIRLRDGRVISERVESDDGLSAIYELAQRHDIEPPVSATAVPVQEHAHA